MGQYFGLLPAAGHGLRMRPFRYPKELLPVHFEIINEDNFIRPKLLIEHSLQSFSLSSIRNIYVIIPDWKPEVMRYLEDGSQFDHNISYLYNSKALGLADALLSGYPWLYDKITCFAMPDTIFSPQNAFDPLLEKLEKNKADLVLGVFPTNEAQHFAPVEFDKNGFVLSIEEKPASPKFNNTYGIAVWNQRFWEFFKNQSNNLSPGISITDIFHKAATNGLNVQCVFFPGGYYKDIGRIDNISIFK